MGLEKEWETYPVFRIDFAGGDYSNSTELIYKIEALLSDWEELIILIGLKTCHAVTFWIARMTRNPVG